jgi:hypothetical protein
MGGVLQPSVENLVIHYLPASYGTQIFTKTLRLSASSGWMTSKLDNACLT